MCYHVEKRGESMIEIVCKDRLQEEKKEENINLPKNIRQVGSPGGRHKIYIEDYVYTYLKTIAEKKESCAAVFLGKSQMAKDIRYTFINGALECGSGVFQWDKICLDDSFWKSLEKEEKKYFPDREIVGWFLGKEGQAMELSPAVEAAHRKYFSGRDKVLMLMDVLEEEEIFFIYDQGYLQKRESYYIYYEKNLPMQEYMIHKRDEEQRLEEFAALKDKDLGIAGVSIPKPEIGNVQKETRNLDQENIQTGTGNLEQEDIQTEAGHLEQEDIQTETDHLEKNSFGIKTQNSESENLQDEIHYPEKGHAKENIENSEESSQSKIEEFRKLHKELETDAGSQEKIFARSNLEEPKTQAEEALESYRNMMLTRHGKQVERQNRRFLYTASSFFLVAVCVLGITTINNYRKMQEVEDVLHVMRSGESSEKRSENQNGVVVESVESQVTPLEEGQQTETGKEPEAGNTPSAQAEGTSSESGDAQSEAAAPASNDTQSEDPASDPNATQSEEPASDSNNGQSEGNSANSENPQPEEAAQEPAQETAAEQPRYYTVQPGDTLASICINIYHSRDMMKKVCEANGIEDGDKIYAGQKLLLP
jgi:LysM repeat protein